MLLSFASFFVVVGIIGAFSLVSKANSVLAHPDVCLGGWNESQYASGKPEHSQGVSLSSDTSALLPENTAAEIFCSKFVTEIPDGTAPTALTLELVLARAPLSEFPSVAVPPLGSATSDPVELETAPEDILETQNSSDTEESVNESVVPEPPLPDEVPSSEEPSAWFQFLFATAHAEELPLEELQQGADGDGILSPELELAPINPSLPSAVDESTLSEQESQSSDTRVEEQDEVESSAEIIFETGAVVPLELFEEKVKSTSDSGLSQPSGVEELLMDQSAVVETVAPGSDPLLEVLMTFDGSSWQTLGTLSEEGFSDARFEVSIPDDFDWKTIADVQVLVRPLVTPVSRPAILLDGMVLSVEYEPLSPDVVPLAELLSEDQAFSLTNRFVLDLKASRGYALVKTMAVDSRTELYAVPLDGARPALRIANELWIAPDSPIGLFEGFAFWVAPTGDVYGFSLARSRFISAQFLGEEADNVEAFKPERLPFGVTVRGTEFAFTDADRGEITSEDDALLKGEFIRQMFDIIPTRDDLVNLHLVSPVPEEESLGL